MAWMSELVPLPEQAEDVRWPSFDWPVTEPPDVIRGELNSLLDATFSDPQPPTTVQTDDMLIVSADTVTDCTSGSDG